MPGAADVVTDLIPLLLHVTRILEDAEIRYVVGGSLASGIHGEIRATNDIDILIELPPQRVPALVAALQPDFDIWEDTVLDALSSGRSFSALHVEQHVKVDFFPAGDSTLDRLQLERRLGLRLSAAPTRAVYFSTPEDIILRKLDWYRRSHDVLAGQLRDVIGVLKLQQEALDLPYLETAAREAELDELLRRCLDEAGLA